MMKRRRKIPEISTRDNHRSRDLILTWMAALITLHCASLAPLVIYIRPRAHHRVMHIPARISNVSVPTEAGTRTIHAGRGERETDRDERDEEEAGR